MTAVQGERMGRRCASCGRIASDPLEWRCTCSGPFEYDWTPRFDPSAIRVDSWSMWRYVDMLFPPELRPEVVVSLGEGMTPMVPLEWDGGKVSVKMEYLMPTASYKDRGTTTLLTLLREAGVQEVVEDSSGNAGASLAAYAGYAGIRARIFVPAHASEAKKSQIARFGAVLHEVEGPREATSRACHAAAKETLYASHAWHPAFLLGQSTAAWEVWEQSGGRLPDAIVVPLGQGGMLLGYYRGFRALQEAGIIERMPRLVGVQAAACAPVVHAWERRASRVGPVAEGATVAEGIRIKSPARGEEILRALYESEGFALTVEDDGIREAQAKLAQRGLFVEATSAVPVAALAQVRERLGADAHVLVPLSGSGLKGQ